MVIIETSVFTRQIQSILTDDEYHDLQLYLSNYPDSGKLVKGGGGLRKIRWSIVGQGKRGGIRIIYFWAAQKNQLLMLFVYPKNEREDLTPRQLQHLVAIIKAEYP
jgi:hypothetical protein